MFNAGFGLRVGFKFIPRPPIPQPSLLQRESSSRVLVGPRPCSSRSACFAAAALDQRLRSRLLMCPSLQPVPRSCRLCRSRSYDVRQFLNLRPGSWHHTVLPAHHHDVRSTVRGFQGFVVAIYYRMAEDQICVKIFHFAGLPRYQASRSSTVKDASGARSNHAPTPAAGSSTRATPCQTGSAGQGAYPRGDRRLFTRARRSRVSRRTGRGRGRS